MPNIQSTRVPTPACWRICDGGGLICAKAHILCPADGVGRITPFLLPHSTNSSNRAVISHVWVGIAPDAGAGLLLIGPVNSGYVADVINRDPTYLFYIFWPRVVLGATIYRGCISIAFILLEKLMGICAGLKSRDGTIKMDRSRHSLGRLL